jgi:hypothetical protein
MANIYFKNGQLFKNDEVILDSDNTFIVRNKPLDPGRGGTFLLENPAALGSGVDFIIENMGSTGVNVVNFNLGGDNVLKLTRNGASDFILNLNTTQLRLVGSLLQDQTGRTVIDNVGNTYIRQDSKLYIYSNAGDNKSWDISRDIVGGSEDLIILNNTTSGGNSEAFRIGVDNEVCFRASASTPTTLGADLILTGTSGNNNWQIHVGRGAGAANNVLRINSPVIGNVLEFTPSAGINLKDNLIINNGFNITNKFGQTVIESTVGSNYSNCTAGHQFYVNGTAGYSSSQYWYMYADNGDMGFKLLNGTGGPNPSVSALTIDSSNSLILHRKNGNPGGQGGNLILEGVTGYNPYGLSVSTGSNNLYLSGPAGTAMYFTNAGGIYIQHNVLLSGNVSIRLQYNSGSPAAITRDDGATVINSNGDVFLNNTSVLTLLTSSAIRANNGYNIIASNGSIDLNAGGGNTGILSFLNNGYADLYSGSYITLRSGSYIILNSGSVIKNTNGDTVINGVGNITVNNGAEITGQNVTNDGGITSKAIIGAAGDIYIRPSGSIRKTSGSFNSQYRTVIDATGNAYINYGSGLYMTTSGSGGTPTYGIVINWDGDIYVQASIRSGTSAQIIDTSGNITVNGVIKRPNGFNIIDSGGNINVDGSTLTAFNSGKIQLGSGSDNGKLYAYDGTSIIIKGNGDANLGVVTFGSATLNFSNTTNGTITGTPQAFPEGVSICYINATNTSPSASIVTWTVSLPSPSTPGKRIYLIARSFSNSAISHVIIFKFSHPQLVPIAAVTFAEMDVSTPIYAYGKVISFISDGTYWFSSYPSGYAAIGPAG